ncbi:hypothetical protein SBA2_750026 [Acidobacteriia bacterium SbA2]|nr:hypothetical protein SBA2_750026 [Acidobacteriia bacterium SbA2]
MDEVQHGGIPEAALQYAERDCKKQRHLQSLNLRRLLGEFPLRLHRPALYRSGLNACLRPGPAARVEERHHQGCQVARPVGRLRPEPRRGRQSSPGKTARGFVKMPAGSGRRAGEAEEAGKEKCAFTSGGHHDKVSSPPEFSRRGGTVSLPAGSSSCRRAGVLRSD